MGKNIVPREFQWTFGDQGDGGTYNSNQPVGTDWTLNLDFEDGVLGDVVMDQSPTYNNFPFFTDAQGDTIYSNGDGIATPFETICAKMSINLGDDGFGSWGGRITFDAIGVENLVKGKELWVSIKMFMPIGFDYIADPRLKFLRLHTMSDIEPNEGFNDWYITPDNDTGTFDGVKNNFAPYIIVKEQQDINYFVGESTDGTSDSVDRPVRGEWATYEIYYRLDDVAVDDGGTSRVRVWRDDKLLADLTDIETLNTADSFADAFLVFTFWNGLAPQTQFLFIDDLILTTQTPTNTDAFGNPRIKDLV